MCQNFCHFKIMACAKAFVFFKKKAVNSKPYIILAPEKIFMV